MKKALALALLLLAGLTLQAQEDTEEKAGLSALHGYVIVPPDHFSDTEFLAVKKALEEKEIPFSVVTRVQGLVKGMSGLEIEAEKDLDAALATLDTASFLVFIGGSGTTEYFKDEQIKAIIRRGVRQRKLVAAICLAPSLLARARVLEGKKATVWSSEAQTLKQHGAEYLDEPVVTDGRFITANGPGAAPAFGEAVIQWLTFRMEQKDKADAMAAEPLELREEGKLEEARKALLKIYTLHKNNPFIGAKALFEVGYTLYAEKKPEEARKAFQRCAAEFPSSDYFGMAQFNAAHLIDSEKFPEKAVAAFRVLITGDCNDWDDTGQIMSPYRNYRYKAILRIGHIYMNQKRYGEALQAFLDAYHKDYFASHCGTCMDEANKERRALTAQAAAALISIETDDIQKETMEEAAKADAYLEKLAEAYLAAGEKVKAKKVRQCTK